jgi:hypothetical protein
VKDLIDLIVTALQANSELKTWCQSKYTRDLFICVGIDPNQAPMYENCPMIVIATGTRYREQRQNYRVYSLRIGCAIEDSTVTSQTYFMEHQGFERIDEFSNLVEKIITKTLNANGYASTQEPEFEDVFEPPHFEAVFTYRDIKIKSLI